MCIAAVLLCLCFQLSSQEAQRVLKGMVLSTENEALIGANVYWMENNKGVTTDENGSFEITKLEGTVNLIVSYVGYVSDTINITDQKVIFVALLDKNTFDDLLVQARRAGINISDLNPIKTESINQVELTKAACCDLAGCFETQSTVQPQTTNVITNSKELRILGLSGVYNQILIDGFPMIQALSYTYGISSLPGSLVDNIHISKGANSVVQGFESITGQINVETKMPDNTDMLYVNGYINNFMEKHVNVNYAFSKGKWSNLTAFHTVQPSDKVDRDEDNFLDLPLLTRYMLHNKWKYGDSQENGWNSTVGVRLLSEERVGGQLAFDPQSDQGSTQVYGQTVQITQPEITTRTGYRFDNHRSISLIASSFHQNQNSYFGSLKYDARQTNAYANVQYEYVDNSRDFKTGVSFRHLNIVEDIEFTDDFLLRSFDGRHQRTEYIPGIFAENTQYMMDDRLVWIAGVRADHHNEFGMKFTPRTLIKYDIKPRSIIRANVGLGWRTVNLFSENIGLLASSRDIIFTEELLPEQALNYGVNFTQKFNSEDESVSGYFSVDFYRTTFSNQIFPDFDTNPQMAIIENFNGKSVSNGFQAELYFHFWNRLELKGGYNWLDVYRIIGEEKQLLPFNPRHKVLTTVSYKPLSAKYHIDLNMKWFDEQRLPDTRLNPGAFQRPDFSETFTLINAQFTYNFGKFEVYLGVENILDFRQLQPILGWEDPFSPFFDTSFVWGPTRGRESYLGFRYKI
jgi:outer membrane receptor for ferrienterochelin and colicins